MSIFIYDFLDESVLPDFVDAQVTDDRLLAELESYRSHAIRSVSEIQGELSAKGCSEPATADFLKTAEVVDCYSGAAEAREGVASR